jgi:hypothetical protein
MHRPTLLEREQIVSEIRAIKAGAAAISQLLAEDVLGGDDLDRAAGVLAEFRADRCRLDHRLSDITATVALMWDCDL